MQGIRRASTALAASRRSTSQRWLHASSSRHAISKLAMPAMSPTMTEGGIAQWKLKEGDAFSAGDVLLEVETDKATIDVEAQDDGVLGKILSLDGSKNVPVGKIIALIAEDGDDISNLEVPKEDPSEAAAPKQESQPETPEKGASAATPSDIERQQPPKQNSHEIHIKHSNPLFPSVQRLLTENGLENADAIKGTGIRGMLTKGDVLAYLGKVSTPLGSYKPLKSIFPESKKPIEEQKPMDGVALRRLISSTMLQNSIRARSIPPPVMPYDFDSVIADYLPESKSLPSADVVQRKDITPSTSATYFDGLI